MEKKYPHLRTQLVSKDKVKMNMRKERERDWGGAGKEGGKLREEERIFLERILQRFLCESSKTEKLEIKTCQVGAKKLSPYSTFDPTAVPDFNQISVM